MIEELCFYAVDRDNLNWYFLSKNSILLSNYIASKIGLYFNHSFDFLFV